MLIPIMVLLLHIASYFTLDDHARNNLIADLLRKESDKVLWEGAPMAVHDKHLRATSVTIYAVIALFSERNAA